MKTAWRLLAGVYCALLAVPAPALEIGRVALLQGRADARDASGQLRQLQQGQVISDQEVLRTKSDGGVLLAMHDGSRIVMGGNSRLEIVHYTAGAGAEALLQLVRGRIQLRVAPSFAAQAFVVQTSEARIPVSGAELEISAEFARTQVLVLTGAMRLQGASGGYDGVVLYAGQGAIIATGQRPMVANLLSGEEGAAALHNRSVIHSGSPLDLSAGGLQSADPAGTAPVIPSALPLPQQLNPP